MPANITAISRVRVANPKLASAIETAIAKDKLTLKKMGERLVNFPKGPVRTFGK